MLFAVLGFVAGCGNKDHTNADSPAVVEKTAAAATEEEHSVVESAVDLVESAVETAEKAVVETAEKAVSAIEEATSDENMDVYFVIGYALAQQTQLNVGFNEDQVDAMLKGVRSLAIGEEPPANFNELMTTARDTYISQMQSHKEKALVVNKEQAAAFLAEIDKDDSISKTESGLRYKISDAGGEEKPTKDSVVKLNYRGTLTDGTEFDKGEGVDMQLSRVVPGFAEAVQLLGPGGKGNFYLPASIAYGDRGTPGGPIGPEAAISFEIEVISISNPPTQKPSIPAHLQGKVDGSRPPAGGPPGPPPNVRVPPPPGDIPPPPSGVPPTQPPSSPPSGPPPSN